MNKTISFIIPTINRPSLQKTLSSMGEWPGDQVIVVEDKLRDGLWGNRQRNEGMAAATCDYLAFMMMMTGTSRARARLWIGR